MDRLQPEAEPGPSVAATPWWYEQGLIVACSTVIGWGGAGLLLAYRGEYTLARAAVLGSLGTLIGLAVIYIRMPHRPHATAATRPTLAMIAGAGAVGLWNAAYAGHHVAGDRDPGIYLLAGKWIAAHGSLNVPLGTGWPALPQLTAGSAGMYIPAAHTAQFQFAHFLPVLLAEGNGIGGDGLMFRVNAIVGALALLVLYAVGCRLCQRPWIVAAAVLGLGVSIPEINCVRDAFSEPSTQLVLWTGIWLLMLAFEHRGGRRHFGVALVGGAALGATLMTRIDGMAYLVFLPPLAALGWLARGERGERRNLLLTYGAVIVGAIPAAVLGTLDVQRRAGFYYHDLRHDVMSLYKAFAAMTVLSVLLVIVWPRVGRVREWIIDRRAPLAATGAWAAAVGVILAWSIRPAIQKLRLGSGPRSAAYRTFTSGLQTHEGLGIDGLRTYGERSLEWFSWYLGPIALLAATVGLGYLAVRLVRRPVPAVAIVLFVAAPFTVLYLWNSHITGDQPWAMRRFVPAALPLVALLAAAGADVVCDLADRAFPARVRIAAGFAVLALVAFPIGRTLPVRALSTDANYSVAIDKVCTTIGPHAAILNAPDFSGDVYTQTFRDWCNVPVERLRRPIDAATVQSLAASWKAKGRTLWLIGLTSAVLPPLASPPQLIASTASSHEVEVTLSRPPEHYTSNTLTIWGEPAG